MLSGSFSSVRCSRKSPSEIFPTYILVRVNEFNKVAKSPLEEWESFGDYIKGQVLADSIEIGDNAGVETEFDDFKLNILVEKN